MRWLAFILFAALSACSNDDACTPGRSFPCHCDNGADGAQVCGGKGSFGACQCANSGGTSGGTSGSRDRALAVIQAPSGPLVAGSTVSVDASQSQGLNLAYQWQLAAPAGSTALLSGAQNAQATFVADLAGTYTVSLVVTSGTATSQKSVSVVVFQPITNLAFGVVDADYSSALDRIVAVSVQPSNQLHCYDAINNADSAIDLPDAPETVALTPDGQTAVVGYASGLSVVTLTAAPAIAHTWPLAFDAAHATPDATGKAYVVSNTDLFMPSLAVVDLATGAVTSSAPSEELVEGSVIRLQPATSHLYLLPPLSPGQVLAYDVSGATPAAISEETFSLAASYQFSENFWFSADGTRLFGDDAAAFSAPGAGPVDMAYSGALGSLTSAVWIRQSPSTHSIYAIAGVVSFPFPTPGAAAADSQVTVFDDAFLALQQTLAVPQFVATPPAVAHGKFVFSNADGSHVFVIAQADASAGLAADFGVAVF